MVLWLRFCFVKMPGQSEQSSCTSKMYQKLLLSFCPSFYLQRSSMFTKYDTCEFIYNAHFISSPVDTHAIASGMKIWNIKKKSISKSIWIWCWFLLLKFYLLLWIYVKKLWLKIVLSFPPSNSKCNWIETGKRPFRFSTALASKCRKMREKKKTKKKLYESTK